MKPPATGRVGDAVSQVNRVGRLGQRECDILSLGQLHSLAIHGIRGQVPQRIGRANDGTIGGSAMGLHLDIGKRGTSTTKRIICRYVVFARIAALQASGICRTRKSDKNTNSTNYQDEQNNVATNNALGGT